MARGYYATGPAGEPSDAAWGGQIRMVREFTKTGIPRYTLYGIPIVPMEAFRILVDEVRELRERVARLEQDLRR